MTYVIEKSSEAHTHTLRGKRKHLERGREREMEREREREILQVVESFEYSSHSKYAHC